MRVFISHSQADTELAQQVAEALRREGLEPWLDADHIFPGDNWAAVTANALESSQAMVLVISDEWLNSRYSQQELEFALGNENFKHRLVSVVVSGSLEIPWVLQRMPMIQVSARKVKPGELDGIGNFIRSAA